MATKNKSPKKPFLVKDQQPEVPAELLQEALNLIAHEEFYEFASHLETARAMLHKYPALVLATEFPEFLRKHYLEEYDQEPNEDGQCISPEIDVPACIELNALTPEIRDQLLPKALDVARTWLKKKIAG